MTATNHKSKTQNRDTKNIGDNNDTEPDTDSKQTMRDIDHESPLPGLQSVFE